MYKYIINNDICQSIYHSAYIIDINTLNLCACVYYNYTYMCISITLSAIKLSAIMHYISHYIGYYTGFYISKPAYIYQRTGYI